MVAFWQGLNYIIDCYGFYSNSAISVNTFIRSIAGAAFVSLSISSFFLLLLLLLSPSPISIIA